MPLLPTPQISEKLSQLQSRRQETADKWQEKMDWLQLGEPLWECRQEGGALRGKAWALPWVWNPRILSLVQLEQR